MEYNKRIINWNNYFNKGNEISSLYYTDRILALDRLSVVNPILSRYYYLEVSLQSNKYE